MNQLNLAATFAATTVLTMFSLACWLFGDRSFEAPMKAEQAAYVARQSENFGGMFGVRGPHSLQATADLYATGEAKLYLRRHKPAVRDYSDYVVPVSAVSR
jgi:hypothetical protein